MAAARAVTGGEQGGGEIFQYLKYFTFSTKCSSPTIVVSDSKPVPFKPYETTKDVKAKVRLTETDLGREMLILFCQAVESKRASETGSTGSKSVSPHIDTR